MIKSTLRSLTTSLGLILFLLAMAPSSQAALQIQITRSADSAIPVAISPFGGNSSTDIAGIVDGDLGSTGLFKMFPRKNMLAQPSSPDDVNYDNWRTLDVSNLVVGSVEQNGGGYKIHFDILDASQGKSVASYEINAGQGQLRQAAHTVSNLVYQYFIGKKGYFLSRIAYVTVTGNRINNRKYRLVVANYDGTRPQAVYTSSDPIMSPTWSPDGRKIAYVAFDVHKGVSNVRVQDLDNGKVRTISTSAGVNGAPAWSPNGNEIALAKSTNGTTNIYVYNLNSGQLRQLTNGSAIDTGPSWSSDGSRIAFTSNRGGHPQIYTMDSRGGQVQRLTYEGKSNQRPTFSPDGKSIAMVQQGSQGYRIAVMDLKNNNTRIVSDGPLDDSPSFAPNGEAILFAEQGRKDALVVVSTDGDARAVLSESGEVRSPAWGPFGH